AELLPEFERTTGYRVEVTKSGEQVYDFARQGQADLVISHYGHAGVEAFMAEDLGLWPRPVFSNQAVLIGPSTDPAGIRGLTDAVEAFRRIARTNSRFLVNNAPTEKYLGQLLVEASGAQNASDWYTDSGVREQQAIQTADRMGAYVFWGIVPFLKFRESTQTRLEPMVVDDSVLQRLMVSIVVNPEKISGINTAGAIALQNYLAAPATQARVRAFRYPGLDYQIFWPAARDNSGAFLTAVEVARVLDAPLASAVVFDLTTVRAGERFTATFSGSNLAAETYFDVRFRGPGSSTDQVALNWQQGPSAVHPVPASSAAGVWTVTGIRAHRNAADHTGTFTSVSVTLTVLR
ncbi:MAG: substrate-binding domain-containing protein, partial [Acidobacteria bacterium]|nr:substrate-binding domain-containing protein [Acidobacteriota bacterium]